MAVICRGIDSIRFLPNIKAPLLIAPGSVLLGWACVQAGGFGPILAQPSAFAPGGPRAGQLWGSFWPAPTGMIGSWATLATNIVGPANDFAHLWPRRIGLRAGGLITGLVGIAIEPWRLIADPTGSISTWLVADSALLGAVGGLLIADDFVLRWTRLDLPGLDRADGACWYASGFNPAAIVALVLGIAPCVPGSLSTIRVAAVAPVWMSLDSYAWFLSFGIACAAYLGMMAASRREAA